MSGLVSEGTSYKSQALLKRFNQIGKYCFQFLSRNSQHWTDGENHRRMTHTRTVISSRIRSRGITLLHSQFWGLDWRSG